MIEKTKRENENLTKLKSQMKDMSAAFEVLKNTRIENKRQMEQKFDDTYEEIRENKEQTIASMNHVHDVVNQFQIEFDRDCYDNTGYPVQNSAINMYVFGEVRKQLIIKDGSYSLVYA